MIDKLVSVILKNKWTWIIFALIVASIYVYGVIQENRELKAERLKHRQNEIALQDSISKVVDSVQVLAIKVEDLQSESELWKGKYIATSTRYEIALDTIFSLRQQGTTQIVGDSIGVVSFTETQSIATIQCTTEVNVKTKTSTYSYSLMFSPINVKSNLFYDEEDGLWKIRTVALSPGVSLRGLGTIDDETFRKIQGLKPIQPTTPSSFGVGGLFAYDRVYGGVVFSPSQWSFSLHYKVFDKYLEDERWSDKLIIGVHYFLW